MPCARVHRDIATIAGLATGLYSARDLEGAAAVVRVLAAVAMARAGGSLPDVLEPATSSWHRGTFHSAGALAGSGLMTLKPPAAFAAWTQRLERQADAIRARRALLPADHPDAFRLWLEEMLLHAAIGAAVGLFIGVASHLLLDAATPRGLPLV